MSAIGPKTVLLKYHNATKREDTSRAVSGRTDDIFIEVDRGCRPVLSNPYERNLETYQLALSYDGRQDNFHGAEM